MRQHLPKRTLVPSNTRKPVDHLLKTLACIGLAAVSFATSAETFSTVESQPISELWLNAGFYSFHFQKDKGFNNNNFGPGVEYRYSTVSSVTFGAFDNSDNHTSRFAGWYWQPLGLGPVRLGAVVGAMDGYRKMNAGGWFLTAIPAVSVEYKNIGANVLIVPNYKDSLHGAIYLQLKLKIF